MHASTNKRIPRILFARVGSVYNVTFTPHTQTTAQGKTNNHRRCVVLSSVRLHFPLSRIPCQILVRLGPLPSFSPSFSSLSASHFGKASRWLWLSATPCSRPEFIAVCRNRRRSHRCEWVFEVRFAASLTSSVPFLAAGLVLGRSSLSISIFARCSTRRPAGPRLRACGVAGLLRPVLAALIPLWLCLHRPIPKFPAPGGWD